MADPITIAAVGTSLLSGLNSLFGGGGGDKIDPELLQLQKDVGRALLSNFKTESSIRNPFQAALSNQLKARTGDKLPLDRIGLPTQRKNPLQNVQQRSLMRNPAASGGKFNPDGSTNNAPNSFLGGRLQRGGGMSNVLPLLMAKNAMTGGGQ